jgi:hypothetical protein
MKPNNRVNQTLDKRLFSLEPGRLVLVTQALGGVSLTIEHR